VSLLQFQGFMTTYVRKITFAELRASGVRDVLIYCRDHKCSHRIEVSADRITSGCRISSQVSSAPLAASAALTSGRYIRAHMGTG